MKTTQIILKTVWMLALVACSTNQENASADAMEAADSSVAEYSSTVSSAAAVENNKDKEHKFVRTADLKFRAKSVIKSTYDIETITAKCGGFVTYTNLTSVIDRQTDAQVSKDSTLQTCYFTVQNAIVLRVPNTNLDTTLKQIARNIEYLDYRIIKADDVALNILANNMTQKRNAKNEDRLTKAIETRGNKLRETTEGEELLLSKQEKADNALISNLSLQDQIKYSTVNIALYQNQSIQRELIPNDKNIELYEPSLWLKIKDSLQDGWSILETIVVFVFKIWALILLAIAGYFVYKKIREVKG